MKDINHQKSGDIEQLMLRIVNISMIIEAVENMLREKGMIPYDLETVTATVDGKETTMSDLHKERMRAQRNLEDKLLDHKTIPYVGADYADFITKVAASVLHDPDVLEDRLRTDFDGGIDDMVKRYRDLSLFFVNEKPRQLVINRLKEALECYVYGFFQGCALLCRSTLETAIREKIEEKLGQRLNQKKTLGPLLDDAMRFGIISKNDYELANKIKSIGDESAHDLKRVSVSEAFESLTKTKLLLNILY